MTSMNHFTTRRRTGFTLLELMVVVSIVGVLSAALMNRIWFYQEQAEKAAMEQTVGNIRSALALKFADLIVQGKMNEAPDMLNQNPMIYLAQRPGNYAGEYFAPAREDVVSGHWYFDLQNRNLIYSINNKAHFKSEDGDRIRFQIRLVTASETPGYQKSEKSLNKNNIEGVILEQVVPYSWF
jgi:general secretion pathway protein G